MRTNNNIIKSILIFLLNVITYSIGFSQDIIIKRNGDLIKSKVIEIDDEKIKYKKFESLDGPVYNIRKDEVSRIKYQNNTQDVFNPLYSAENKNNITTSPLPVVPENSNATAPVNPSVQPKTDTTIIPKSTPISGFNTPTVVSKVPIKYGRFWFYELGGGLYNFSEGYIRSSFDFNLIRTTPKIYQTKQKLGLGLQVSNLNGTYVSKEVDRFSQIEAGGNLFLKSVDANTAGVLRLGLGVSENEFVSDPSSSYSSTSSSYIYTNGSTVYTTASYVSFGIGGMLPFFKHKPNFGLLVYFEFKNYFDYETHGLLSTEYKDPDLNCFNISFNLTL